MLQSPGEYIKLQWDLDEHWRASWRSKEVYELNIGTKRLHQMKCLDTAVQSKPVQWLSEVTNNQFQILEILYRVSTDDTFVYWMNDLLETNCLLISCSINKHLNGQYLLVLLEFGKRFLVRLIIIKVQNKNHGREF